MRFRSTGGKTCGTTSPAAGEADIWAPRPNRRRSGNSYTWIELKDDLTVSLLQARLIELNLPINVEVCGSLGASA
jgi:hypothetical protein